MFIKVQIMESGKPGTSYTDRAENILASDIFDGAQAGEQYLLTAMNMTEEELAALPEFVGF